MSFDCVFGVMSYSPTDLLVFAFNHILLRSKFYVILLASNWKTGHMKGGMTTFLFLIVQCSLSEYILFYFIYIPSTKLF